MSDAASKPEIRAAAPEGAAGSGDPDAPLVERARGGDRAAFDLLVEAHLERVWRVVFRIVRDEADAEDVSQDVFLTAWQGLPGFRGEARFSTWLHQIAVSRALNHRERSAERLRRASLSIVPREAAAQGDGGGGESLREAGTAPELPSAPSQLAALEAAELRRRLARCLEELPSAWRAIFALREGEGMPYEEIAQVARIELGTVRSRLARARAALRDCLAAGAAA